VRTASLILTVWVGLGPTGCRVWTTASPLPTAANGLHGEPKLVRLTLNDGRVMNLRNPAIRNDSINGVIEDGGTIAFPLGQVRQLDRPQFNKGRTVALVIGIGAAAFVTYIALGFYAFSQGGN
jgi:hypothetical protein